MPHASVAHVPFLPWVRPLAIWGGYVLLLLTALFCLNTIMRRKWAESERYPMPNARIPLALAGAGPGDEGSDAPFAAIWRNRWAWAGLVFAFLFGVLKGAQFFNPHFPDLKFSHYLGDYVSNPVFGGMFNVEFAFSLLICSVAVFFELNVLMSIVVGYWVCRSAYFFGHLAGIDSNSGFPWFDEQALGAYIGYFAIILVLSIAKVRVRTTMLVSLAAALVICVTIQHINPLDLPGILVFGYQSPNLAIARMVNGGGILSMAEIIAIVGVAATYSGLFSGTGLLVGLHEYVTRIARRSTPFISVLATSIATCTVACDQVVAIMLTRQLCDEVERSDSALALDLENSAAIISSIVPWSTSCIGIIAFVGMPMESVAFNFLTMLIPLWTLAISVYQHRHPGFSQTRAARALGLDTRDDARLSSPADADPDADADGHDASGTAAGAPAEKSHALVA